MKRINDHTGFLETESELLNTILAKWQPQTFALDERDYDTDLFATLRKALPDGPMTTQHGLAKGRADIVIEDSHIIELKLGFNDVLEFDRCIGQLERYYQRWVKKDRGPVYLLVVGDSDSDLRDMLHIWFEEANSRFFTWSPFTSSKNPHNHWMVPRLNVQRLNLTNARETSTPTEKQS